MLDTLQSPPLPNLKLGLTPVDGENLVRLTLIEVIRVNSDDPLTVELLFRKDIFRGQETLNGESARFLANTCYVAQGARRLPGSPRGCSGPRGSLQSLKRMSNRETRNKFDADPA